MNTKLFNFSQILQETSGPALHKPLVLAGIRSFQKLIKIELAIQNRSKDAEHTETIRKLRNGEIDDTFVNNLKSLTVRDVNNGGWRFVPILVTSNAEAILLNKIFNFTLPL